VLRLPSYSWDLKNYWIQYVNDWSLYKGDAGFLQGLKEPGISTTCVQRLVDEKTEGKMITVIFESDLLREDMDPMVRGHRVNGVSLCTPSVYADIALTVGDYLRRQKPQWKSCLVDVQHMDVQKPLVAKSKGQGPQYLRTRVMLNAEGGKGAVEFYTATSEGKKLTKHAECTITFPDAAIAASDIQEKVPAILDRMEEFRKNTTSDSRVQKLYGNTGYKLVSSLASYDEFKGVEDCILDSANLEAASKVRFKTHDKKGTFHVNPHLVDNFGQPALFTMNANDTADLDKEVFVNHGWTSLHFYKPVSMGNTYRSYVKMSRPKEDGMYTGDMIVFEGDELVAAFKGVKAQGVPRRLMDYIVSMRDDAKAGHQKAPAKQDSAQTQERQESAPTQQR
jgi:iterative type I PKS product template protein